MTFSWRYDLSQAAAPDAERASQSFPTQSDAETWIGESWRELATTGVDAVTLMEDDHEVYGPMSLHAG